jgi:glycerol-3-phosphate O-acyltransferase
LFQRLTIKKLNVRKSFMSFSTKVEHFTKTGKLPPKLSQILVKFHISYSLAVKQNGHDIAEYDPLLLQFLDLVVSLLAHPFRFEPYHEGLRSPIDYYQLGLDMLRPLVIFESSKVFGLEHVAQLSDRLSKGDNVILFANHQTEPDPQAISLLLENTFPKLAEEMIFVAGQRVISDPLAIPLSMGRNLLCIFSKKYIETPPEQKEEKRVHNQKTMKKMGQLLSEGGKCIYVAPSGGRDRPCPDGKLNVARFDPQSIEMFWLMAQQVEHPTHFYPLALATYNLLPPPNSVEKELGERRHTQCTPIHIGFGKEIDMINYPGSEIKDKRQKRKIRSDYIWELVKNEYKLLTGIDESNLIKK